MAKSVYMYRTTPSRIYMEEEKGTRYHTRPTTIVYATKIAFVGFHVLYTIMTVVKMKMVALCAAACSSSCSKSSGQISSYFFVSSLSRHQRGADDWHHSDIILMMSPIPLTSVIHSAQSLGLSIRVFWWESGKSCFSWLFTCRFTTPRVFGTIRTWYTSVDFTVQ